jgi:hypothetical protein
LVAFDVILGLPWLRQWNPVVDWRGEKLIVNVGGQNHVMNASLDPTAERQSDVKTKFVSAVHEKNEIRKGSDWFMVHVNAVKADVQTGLSTKNDNEKLNNEWRALIEKYDDVFPEEHPCMPSRRNVELKIESKEGPEPVSKPVYRLSPGRFCPRWNTLITTLSLPPPGKCRLSCFMDRSRWNSKTSCCRHQLPQLNR